MKHTPGPWKTYHENGSMGSGGHWGVETGGGEPCFPAKTICIIAQGDSARANAMLIASAPNLLAALQRLMADIHDTDAIHAAQEAIRKATGAGGEK